MTYYYYMSCRLLHGPSVCVHVRSNDRVTLGLKNLGSPHGSICGSHDDEGSILTVFIFFNDFVESILMVFIFLNDFDGWILCLIEVQIRGVQIRIQLKMMRANHMGLERTFVWPSVLHRR